MGSSAAQNAAWRTGLGVLTETTGTDRAGNIHTVAAAVLLDADGKLAGVTLDELELSVSADSTGKVTTPTDTRTKRQKGKDYPLAEVSGLKKGWAEQAPLATIGEAFGVLPEGHTLSAKEWKQLSSQWREELDRRIHTLVALRDELDGCIGCGCLSRSDCPLRNPGDRLGEEGTGARLLEDEQN